MTATRIWSLTAGLTGASSPCLVEARQRPAPNPGFAPMPSPDDAWPRPNTLLAGGNLRCRGTAPADEEVARSPDQSTLLYCSKVRIQSNGQGMAVARWARASRGNGAPAPEAACEDGLGAGRGAACSAPNGPPARRCNCRLGVRAREPPMTLDTSRR